MKVAVITDSVTRPNDTTTYGAGEVIANGTPVVLSFVGMNQFNNGGFEIRSAVCTTSAAVATKPDLELWLFSETVTMDADNAAFTPTDAEMATLVGIIPFPTASFKAGDVTSGAGGNAACVATNVGIASNKNTLYGVLVVRNAYVPVAQEVFTIRLQVLQDQMGH